MSRIRPLVVVVLALLAAVPSAARAHVQPVGVADADGEWELSVSSPAETRFLTAEGGSARRDGGDPHLIHLRPVGDSMRVRVLSRDGHVTTIEVTSAGGGGGAPAAATGSADGARVVARLVSGHDPPLVVIGRALVFASLLALAGSIIVWRLVVEVGVRNPIREFGRGSGDAGAPLGTTVGPLGRLVGAVGLAGVVMSTVGLAVRLETGDLAGLLGATRVGHVILICAVATAFSLAALSGHARPADGTVTLAAALAIVALVALSVGGHATSGTDAVLGGVFDALHMLATAVWLGGLVAVLAAWRAMRHSGRAIHVGTLAAIVVRFSAVALTCVAALVVTGTYRALAELSTLGDLTQTAYGRALALKLGIFAVMLGVGGYNRLVIHPRLEAAALGLVDDDRGAARALGASVRAELVLASVLIAVVAVMIGLPPPG